MSEVEIKRKEEKVPWLLIILLSTIITIIGTMWTLCLPSHLRMFFNAGDVGCALEFTPLPFIVITLVMLLGARRVSNINMAYLYLVAITCAYWIVDYGGIEIPIRMSHERITNPIQATVHLPDFMAPSAEIVEPMIAGSASTPWIAWLPTIVYWSVLYGFIGVFMISIASISRYQLIDVERLPFPTVIAAYEVIRESQPKALKTWFIAGLIIGFTFQLLVFLIWTFPWFPDILAWREFTACPGYGWLPGGHFLLTIKGLAVYERNMVVAAAFYMAPLAFLQSYVIIWIIYLILMQVAYQMGYYTFPPDVGGCGIMECGTNAIRHGEPFRWVIVGHAAGVIALPLFYLLSRWRFIVSSIKTAFGKMELRNVEEQQGYTYRVAYSLATIGFLGSIAMLMIGGIGFLPALLIPTLACLYYFAAMLVYGRIGYNVLGWDMYGLWPFRLLWPTNPDHPMPREWTLTFILMRQPGSDGIRKGWGAPMASTLQTYRMADLLNTKNVRNLYIALILALIVSIITSWIPRLSFYYFFGLTRLGIDPSMLSTMADPTWTWSGINPAPEPWIPHLIAGIIVIGILTYLRNRFLWFPLDPISYVTAFSCRGLSNGIWDMILVAWILKTITVKIGGSKAYEEYGVPIACGVLLGYALAIILGGIISAIRFFIPF